MTYCAQCIVHFSCFSWTFLKCPCPWGFGDLFSLALTFPGLLWLSWNARAHEVLWLYLNCFDLAGALVLNVHDCPVHVSVAWNCSRILPTRINQDTWNICHHLPLHEAHTYKNAKFKAGDDGRRVYRNACQKSMMRFSEVKFPQVPKDWYSLRSDYPSSRRREERHAGEFDYSDLAPVAMPDDFQEKNVCFFLNAFDFLHLFCIPLLFFWVLLCAQVECYRARKSCRPAWKREPTRTKMATLTVTSFEVGPVGLRLLIGSQVGEPHSFYIPAIFVMLWTFFEWLLDPAYSHPCQSPEDLL